ncbi:hypothetical protein KIH74_18120 [Kineosporia sp. J2-2]|uniref:Uncharacterized protein n=1 Tax=Kineosporia corallincola TaxID=2835133 RepID=A0ABS5TIF4_9ACTN|nr:hypothetical protein [Kineosporia corallincola]MBT0770865.1 hypothetical protein [Kineosporia corallincola]
MSDEGSNRPTRLVTGPVRQDTGPRMSPVYQDVTGRPIPLAEGWEAPEAERPRENRHQQWAGAAAAFTDDAVGLFTADARQSETRYEPPKSYPPTAGGSAFFTGARKAQQDTGQTGQVGQDSRPSVAPEPLIDPSPSLSPDSGASSAPPEYHRGGGGGAFFAGARRAAIDRQTGSIERITGSEPVEQPPVEEFYDDLYQQASPYQQADYHETASRQASFQESYPQTEPAGFEQPSSSSYDYAFTDYQPGQTGSQPQVSGWDQPGQDDGYGSDGYGSDSNGSDGYRAEGGYDQDGRADQDARDDQDTRDGQDARGGWGEPDSYDSAPAGPARRTDDGYPRTYPPQEETFRAPDDQKAPPWQQVQASQPMSGYATPGFGEQRPEPQPPEPQRPDVPKAPAPWDQPDTARDTARGRDHQDGDVPGWNAPPPRRSEPGAPRPRGNGNWETPGGGRLLGGPDPDYDRAYEQDNPSYYRVGKGEVPPGQRPGQGRPGAPPRGGRGPGRRGGYGRKAALVVLVIAALAIGYFISQFGKDDTDVSRPFLREGTVGTPVTLRYAEVTATAVEGSPCLSQGYGTDFRSPEVFVVVPVKVSARGETSDLQYAAIEGGDGRLYVATSAGRGGFSTGSVQVGVPVWTSVAIEMPADAVPGAHLRIALNQTYLSQDDVTDIDLGVSRSEVAQMRKNTKTLLMPGVSAEQPDASSGTTTTACAGAAESA